MANLKRAIVLGGTGLVGSALTELLLNDHSYGKVILISRRPLKISHPKLQVLMVDFENLEEYKLEFQGDVLFSCLGTTIKKAKTKENQFKVDYTYQYDIASICAENDIKNYVLVSSIGANEKSSTFYTRIKGELEVAVNKLNFKNISILRPSFLEGDRKEFRLGEKIGLVLIKIISIFPFLKKYHGIKATTVAKCMIVCAKQNRSGIFESHEIKKMVTNY